VSGFLSLSCILVFSIARLFFPSCIFFLLTTISRCVCTKVVRTP
jgi:hypothetical protein